MEWLEQKVIRTKVMMSEPKWLEQKWVEQTDIMKWVEQEVEADEQKVKVNRAKNE